MIAQTFIDQNKLTGGGSGYGAIKSALHNVFVPSKYSMFLPPCAQQGTVPKSNTSDERIQNIYLYIYICIYIYTYIYRDIYIKRFINLFLGSWFAVCVCEGVWLTHQIFG